MKSMSIALAAVLVAASLASAGGGGYYVQQAPQVLQAPACYTQQVQQVAAPPVYVQQAPAFAAAPVYAPQVLAAPQVYAAGVAVSRQRVFAPAYGYGGAAASVRQFSAFRQNRGFGFGGQRTVIRQRSFLRVR